MVSQVCSFSGQVRGIPLSALVERISSENLIGGAQFSIERVTKEKTVIENSETMVFEKADFIFPPFVCIGVFF